MTKILKHEEAREFAEYLALRFQENGQLKDTELQADGIEKPASVLRNTLVRSYLGSFGVHVRSENHQTRFVAERLLPVDPLESADGARNGKKRPPGPDEDFFYLPREAGVIRSLLAERIPVLLGGPAGCGKSELLARLFREIAGPGPVYTMSLHGETSSDDLFGTKELSGGSTRFRPGPVLQAILSRRPLILNELDVASPEVLFTLQDLAGGTTVTVPMLNDDDGEPLQVNPWKDAEDSDRPNQFALAATANTFGQGDASGLYRGTQVLNSAFLNRWQPVRLDYPPAFAEKKILMQRQGVPAATAEKIVKFASAARKASADSQEIMTTVSVRNTLNWSLYVTRCAMTVEQAFCLSILEGSTAEDTEFLRELYQRVFGGPADPACLHRRER